MKSQQAHDDARMDPLVFRCLLNEPECPVAHCDEAKSRHSELIPEVRHYVHSNERRHDTDDEAVDGETQKGAAPSRPDRKLWVHSPLWRT
jgi:hypothetical protein